MKLRNIAAKSDLEYYKQHINFAHEEEIVFDMLSKGKSIKEIADKLNTSESTVSRKIKSVKEKMGGLMDMEKQYTVPIWEKVALTKEEASEYSHIGINKLEELTRNPMCPFVISVGRKRLIKRKEFEQYISDNIEI
jgi:excisionase family DNA binding protein